MKKEIKMSTTIDMSALDIDMNSVEDLKGFEVPPEGSYSCLVSLVPKVFDGETKVVWEYTVVEPLELNDPDAVVPADASFNTIMGLKKVKTAKGEFDPRSFYKTKTTILAEALGVANNPRELVEAVQNIQVTCFLKHKLQGDKTYADVIDAGFVVG